MFSDYYFKKYDSYPVSIAAEPHADLNIIIVIPCYNELFLINSLESLAQCDAPDCNTEVIVVINSSENSDKNIIEKNLRTYNDSILWANIHNSAKITFQILNITELPKKIAGVGMARKIGMDAALLRFAKLNRPDGIIVGFDADSLCDKNYLTEINNFFSINKQLNAASIYFEHPVSGIDFDAKIYHGIIEYELHLRYFNQALRYCEFPYAYHTIGSSFAVRANTYMKQGGMNKRQAGEDFYFLHKVIPLEKYGEINTTRVIPSPRPSDRVPFGTGAAVEKFIGSGDDHILTYNFDSFGDISAFFSSSLCLFNKTISEVTDAYFSFAESIKLFVTKEEFLQKINECNSNSSNFQNFKKRFFVWFDAFKIIRFLNTMHEGYYKKQQVVNEAIRFLESQGNSSVNENALALLQKFRLLDRGIKR